ncbi:MAG: RNA polymerase sigma factor RpoH [Rhodospirillales bacterium]|nr:RNA polymerase sigma factor RpoH [Rhodospirillales bacterium]
MASTISLPAVPVDGGLSQYFREIWTYPILEKDEEQRLGTLWREKGDTEAAHKLVTSHLRLVVKLAMKYRGYGLPVADLISEGNIGLMRAVKKFEPDMGFRLSTYAMWWIKASITEYVLKSWSMVKMGTVASQKKLFFSLRNVKAKLNILDSGDLTADQAKLISSKMGVPEKDIIHMNGRLSVRDMSLNAPMSQSEDSAEFIDSLVDDGASPEQIFANREQQSVMHEHLAKAVASLPERERHIFTERKLKDNPVTLEELGQSYGISRERVRQLEARAFDRVQKAVVIAAREQGADPKLYIDAAND